MQTELARDEKNRFVTGNIGGPGRPKGSRNKLGEAFVHDLLADWETNGIQAIQDMRDKSPTDYCKVVASVIPKEIVHTLEDYDSLSDDELAAEFNAVASRLAERSRDRQGNGEAAIAGTVPN